MGRWHHVRGAHLGFVNPREYCEGCLKFRELTPGRRDCLQVYKWLKEASDKQQEERSRMRKEQQEARKREQEAQVVKKDEEAVTQELDAKLLVTNLKGERVLSEFRRQDDRGDTTPPSSPKGKGAGNRSPGAKAKSFSRLLQFQQRLEDEQGLPPSWLKERRREITPGSSPRLRPARCWGTLGEGIKLEKEFERIGVPARVGGLHFLVLNKGFPSQLMAWL